MNKPYTKEDVNELYRLIGKAIWHLQHLENTIASFMVFKKLQKQREKGIKISQKDLDETHKQERKKTLGPLIKSAIQENVIPNQLTDSFGKHLDERNWLIHKCVINEFLSLRNCDAKLALFKKISTFTNSTIDLQNELDSLFDQWYVKNGYDLNQAYERTFKLLSDAEQN